MMRAMRIGINGSTLIALGSPLSDIVEHAVQAEADGFGSYWLAQLAVPDALTAIAVIGPRTSTMELGTAVVPTWLRHPLMLAGQCLTVQEATGNRLIIGIGLAHKAVIEAALKVPFAKPAQHMEEYLNVLLPAMQDRKVSFEGEIWSGEIEGLNGASNATAPSVMLAAMGPRMLELAGSRTDGTILWLSGPNTIATRIKPAVDAAAEQAGRPAPRIVASVPVCVTSRPDDMKGLLGAVLSGYNDLPSYRGVMDAEGASGPADVSLIGDEDEVRAGLEAFAAAGATDFAAAEVTTDPDDQARTRALLIDVAGA